VTIGILALFAGYWAWLHHLDSRRAPSTRTFGSGDMDNRMQRSTSATVVEEAKAGTELMGKEFRQQQSRLAAAKTGKSASSVSASEDGTDIDIGSLRRLILAKDRRWFRSWRRQSGQVASDCEKGVAAHVKCS
jgi:hypothetical protein